MELTRLRASQRRAVHCGGPAVRLRGCSRCSALVTRLLVRVLVLPIELRWG